MSTARSKNDPELMVAGQDEAIQFVEAPDESGANRSQPTQSRGLSPREAEIARLVAGGLSNKQIARRANITDGTVKVHLCNAYKKLGIANRTTLAVMVSSGAGAWGLGR